jgi:hypothetical protein
VRQGIYSLFRTGGGAGAGEDRPPGSPRATAAALVELLLFSISYTHARLETMGKGLQKKERERETRGMEFQFIVLRIASSPRKIASSTTKQGDRIVAD